MGTDLLLKVSHLRSQNQPKSSLGSFLQGWAKLGPMPFCVQTISQCRCFVILQFRTFALPLFRTFIVSQFHTFVVSYFRSLFCNFVIS